MLLHAALAISCSHLRVSLVHLHPFEYVCRMHSDMCESSGLQRCPLVPEHIETLFPASWDWVHATHAVPDGMLAQGQREVLEPSLEVGCWTIDSEPCSSLACASVQSLQAADRRYHQVHAAMTSFPYVATAAPLQSLWLMDPTRLFPCRLH